MSASHQTGAKESSRIACAISEQSYPINIATGAPTNTVLAAGKLLAFIKATALKPCIIEAEVYVQTAVNGTSPVILVGFTPTGNDLIASGDSTAGTIGFYPASNAVKKKFINSDTTIYVSMTGSGFTTGLYWIRLRITELNTKSIH